MTRLELARRIKKYSERAPITRSFEIELTARGLWDPEREKKKYPSQKMHWLGWLSEYGGAGAFNRKNRGVRSAEIVYNRIVCPPMVLWLTETAGVPKRQVKLAMQSALFVAPSFARQCAAMRKIISWSTLEGYL
jgi:hypothetical protein